MNSEPQTVPSSQSDNNRIALMRICAHAREDELLTALSVLGPLLAVADVRKPHAGLVMVRGRIGGVGSAFNIGEALVTRASVMLEDGTIGHAYLLGRSEGRARLAAIVDAFGQNADKRQLLEESLVAPVSARLAQERQRKAEETASTRVDFFTLVRGENQ